MKRIAAIGIVFLLILVSSCKGTKYCPTYSKGSGDQPVEVEKDIRS